MGLSIIEMVRNGQRDEEAVIYVAYFKIIYAMGVERRDKGSALFHMTYSMFVRQLHHVALDGLESHTPFPGPTT